jgi:hypothetical protein
MATEADPWKYKSPAALRVRGGTAIRFITWASQATKIFGALQAGPRIHSALGGTSRTFFGASARSIAFSAAATASARPDA